MFLGDKPLNPANNVPSYRQVTRIIIALFSNLLNKPEENKLACVSMIQSKCLPIFNVLEQKGEHSFYPPPNYLGG